MSSETSYSAAAKAQAMREHPVAEIERAEIEPPASSSSPPSSTTRSKPPPLPESAGRLPPERALADAEFAERMLERLAAGDYVGALLAATALLETQPRHQDALDTAQMARSELRRLYATRLGSLDQVPRVVVGRDALFAMQPLDFRAGLVLSRVDGTATLGDIAGACGIPEHEALRVLSELYLNRVIALATVNSPPPIPA